MPGACVALPPLADDFVSMAESHGVRQDSLVQNLLYKPGLPPVSLTVVNGVKQTFDWVSGHNYGANDPKMRGPRKRCKAVIVGKCLGRDEVRRRQLFVGKSGVLLNNFLKQAGLDDVSEIYLSNLLKTQPLQSGKFKTGWVKVQQMFLTLELMLVRPKYVLALGNDVVKWFLKRGAKMVDVENRWQDCELDLRLDEGEEKTDENTHKFQVLPCMHPAALEYEEKPEDRQRIADTCRTFVAAVSGSDGADGNDSVLPNYPVVSDIETLRMYCARFLPESTLNLIAVDAEWQGSHPQNAGSYLRCVQFAWAPGKAITVKLTDTEGRPAFVGSNGVADVAARMEAFQLLTDTFNQGLRICGFFFPADYEWLTYYGWDTEPWYEAAPTVQECRHKGGFALELAANAVDELGRNNLDSNRWRYTSIPPYEHTLHEYRDTKKKEAKDAKDDELYAMRDAGYGWIPDEILCPYAAADVDVTLQASLEVMNHLDSDRFGLNCWLPYFNSLRASMVAAEIMRVGIPFDTKRCLELAVPYAEVLDNLLKRVRKILRWPDFNPDSPLQVLEAMYGVRYSNKRSPTGERISVRPPGARTLGLVPVLDNDSRSPRPWEDIVAEGSEDLHTPGTNAKTIGVLANDPDGIPIRRMDPLTGEYRTFRVKELPGLELIKDIRTIGQLRKTFVGKYQTEELADGVRSFTFEKGLAAEVCDDGYIRCFISMVKETARWSASGPNLHATPKRKESRYKKIAGRSYPGKFRSVFLAPPGYVIIEADYSSAELFMLALASGDANLWDHCERSALDETDPNFVDIHAGVCVTGLSLPCEPTKAGLKSIDKGYMRDVAKCVVAGERIGTAAGWVEIGKLCRKYLDGKDVARVPDGEFNIQAGSGSSWLRAVHRSGVKECFSVRTAMGYELRVSADHVSFVLRDGQIQELKTSEIKTGDSVLLYPKTLVNGERVLIPSRLRNAISNFTDAQHSAAYHAGALAGVLEQLEVRTQDGISLISVPHGCQLRKAVVRKLAGLWSADSTGEDVRSSSDVYLYGSDAQELLSAAVESNWTGIPEAVFCWGHQGREDFLRGYLEVVSRGSFRSPTYVGESARDLQQLMLSVGMLSQRKSATGKECLTPVGSTTVWWEAAAMGSSYKLPRDSYLGSRIPNVARRLCAIFQEIGGEVPDRSRPPMYTSRKVILEWMNRLKPYIAAMDEDLQAELSLLKFTIMGNAHFEPVESVTSIGMQTTYDVETSPERRHMVVVGGIATHNSVVYGWAYGRQAKAIVIQAKEEGIVITEEEAETIVSGLKTLYPDAADYLESASDRVNDGYLYTPLGRIRRCPPSTDRRTLSKFGREFKNAPMQGGVADVVNQAGYNLRQVRREEGMNFKIVLQVHDAFIFMVPISEVPHMVNYVLPEAMSNRVPITPVRLDGTVNPNAVTRRMNIGIDVHFRWGVDPTDLELAEHGVRLK